MMEKGASRNVFLVSAYSHKFSHATATSCLYETATMIFPTSNELPLPCFVPPFIGNSTPSSPCPHEVEAAAAAAAAAVAPNNTTPAGLKPLDMKDFLKSTLQKSLPRGPSPIFSPFQLDPQAQRSDVNGVNGDVGGGTEAPRGVWSFRKLEEDSGKVGLPQPVAVAPGTFRPKPARTSLRRKKYGPTDALNYLSFELDSRFEAVNLR